MSLFDSRILHLCDAELQSEDGETFHVHKSILAFKSEYFCSMFSPMSVGRRQFTVPGVSGKCLRVILKHIYTGDVPDDKEFTLDLMLAADYLCFADLRLKAKQHLMKNMTLTIYNCFLLLNTAYHTSDEDIIQKNMTFVARNFKEVLVVQKHDFEELPVEVLAQILGSRNLNVSSETTVWQSIVQWTSKDVPARSQCVPQLLTSLARKELDEDLAKEILQHEIVSENFFMKNLNVLKDTSTFTSQSDSLLHFLEKHPGSIKQPLCTRLPPRLQIISYGDYPELDSDEREVTPGTCGLYITYDENIDVWRKVGESSGCLFKLLTVVGHNAYLFDKDRCAKFDILNARWMPMSSIRNSYNPYFGDVSVMEVDGCIYVVRALINVVAMEIYDTLIDVWFDGGTLSDMDWTQAVTLDRKIYAVGTVTDSREMAARVFDTVTKTWRDFPLPSVFRYLFALVTYREKLYAIGGHDDLTDVPLMNEVFDPRTNTWEEFPAVTSIVEHAFVFNDQIIAYHSVLPGAFCWNDVKGQWEEFESSEPINFNRLAYSTVNDEDVIRSATKASRGPGVRLQKSWFR